MTDDFKSLLTFKNIFAYYHLSFDNEGTYYLKLKYINEVFAQCEMADGRPFIVAVRTIDSAELPRVIGAAKAVKPKTRSRTTK